MKNLVSLPCLSNWDRLNFHDYSNSNNPSMYSFIGHYYTELQLVSIFLVNHKASECFIRIKLKLNRFKNQSKLKHFGNPEYIC